MSSRIEHRGACLCGAVKVTAQTDSTHTEACHCAMCLKWGSGPFFSVQCNGGVSFDGEEHISVFDSSEWAERGFCRICGTHLFYRLKQEGFYAIPVGILNDADQWTFTEQIFIDQKPSFYSFANETAKLTGEEVFAKFQSV